MAKKTKKKSKGATNEKSSKRSSAWVDKLGWEETQGQNKLDQNDELEISIISWNILAQSYLTKRSHTGLPRQYQSLVFTPIQRRALVCKTLRKLASMADILLLQEVDKSFMHQTLTDLGFEHVSTPTTAGGGGGGRVDACCIYYLKEKWNLVKSQVVRLDDLAFTNSTNTQVNKKSCSLQGLQQSFLRRNAAILVELQSRKANIVVANAHLYWHPGYEYVKLCQAHYVMQELQKFNSCRYPALVCGDLNSRPCSIVHEYLTVGHVNAKRVAPWYHYNKSNSNVNDNGQSNVARDESEDVVVYETDEKQQQQQEDTDNGGVEPQGKGIILENDDKDCINGISELLQDSCRLDEATSKQVDESSPRIRYLLDFTLNRFTRWLRILGIDAALETDTEEEQRTKHGNFILFDRCKQEKRTLLTTSGKLMLRKDCPPGTYLVDPRNVESSLVHLFLSHGVVLQPRKFLTRCVVCNGNIVQVVDITEKRRIFAANQAPDLSRELNVYSCDGCQQGYWWCDHPDSSATRVKTQATKLFEMCLRGGVPIAGDLHVFDSVNVEQERQKGASEEAECLEVIHWLKDERLSHSLPLQSAYALRQDDDKMGESVSFTNVTNDFVDVLDYIFFESNRFCQTHCLYVPRTFEELNGSDLPNGHLLPSNIWPSDHLAIGARFTLPHSDIEQARQQAEYPNGVNGNISTRKEDTETALESVSAATQIVNDAASSENVHSESEPSTRAPSVRESPSSTMPNGQPGASTLVAVCGNADGPPPAMLPSHGPRCACGCVPNILSLFEMAELRKQARLKAQRE